MVTTVRMAYVQTKNILNAAKIQNAPMEADILFLQAVGKRRIAMQPDQALPDETVKLLYDMANKRAGHYPLQYICGQWPFMNVDIIVGEGVLIPRADTECVVECAINLICQKQNPTVLDLCSGSGAIAVSIKHEIPFADVTAVELSEDAFYYLTLNCKHYVQTVKADVFLYQNQLSNQAFNLIVANPPYITSDEMLNCQAEILAEPRMALTDEGDGLSFYRHIAAAYMPKLKNGGYMVFEIGYTQAQAVADIMKNAGYKNINVINDLCQNPRCVYGSK